MVSNRSGCATMGLGVRDVPDQPVLVLLRDHASSSFLHCDWSVYDVGQTISAAKPTALAGHSTRRSYLINTAAFARITACVTPAGSFESSWRPAQRRHCTNLNMSLHTHSIEPCQVQGNRTILNHLVTLDIANIIFSIPIYPLTAFSSECCCRLIDNRWKISSNSQPRRKQGGELSTRVQLGISHPIRPNGSFVLFLKLLPR